MEVAFQAVKDPRGGSCTGIIGTMRDVSSRKATEAALAEACERLDRLARHDALTGLVNRRGLDEALTVHQRAPGGSAGGSSLIMIDVDRFKAFNDGYGHVAGDACLRQIGEAIAFGCESLLRSADRALYAAKGAGRNVVARSSTLERPDRRSSSPSEEEPARRSAPADAA